MTIKNIEKMKLALARGDFDELDTLIGGNYDMYHSFSVFYELAETVSEIAVYTFFASRLLKEPKNVKLLEEASSYLNFQLLYVNAYSIAVHYDRKVLALEPDNVDHQISLICYATMPDRLVKKKEALKLAKSVIKKRPTNNTAIEILYGWEYARTFLKNMQGEGNIEC